MLIHGNLPQLLYLPATSAPRTDVARRVVAESGATTTRSGTPMTSTRAKIDVIAGVTPRAQRAISAYVQNEVFTQRSEYAQLLGVDVYV